MVAAAAEVAATAAGNDGLYPRATCVIHQIRAGAAAPTLHAVAAASFRRFHVGAA